MFAGSKVTFDVCDFRGQTGVRTFDTEVERTVVARSGYPVVRFEGRYYELFKVASSKFIDLDRPHGRC